MKTPSISVMMPFYNARDFVAEAVASIRLQTFEDWELIVIDDGSTDEGADRIAHIRDPRIRLIRDETNQGLPARLNQAMDLARGKFLARMDADDLAFPQRLARQLNFLQARPLLDVVACNTLVIDPQGNPRGQERWRGSGHAEITAHPQGGFHFNHPTWLGRAGWFRRHRYRVDAHRSEDDDLMLRAFRTSRFYRMPEILQAYRVGKVNPAATWRARSHYAKSLWREAVRHGDARLATGVFEQMAKAGAERMANAVGAIGLVSGHRHDDRAEPRAEAEYRDLLARISQVV